MVASTYIINQIGTGIATLLVTSVVSLQLISHRRAFGIGASRVTQPLLRRERQISTQSSDDNTSTSPSLLSPAHHQYDGGTMAASDIESQSGSLISPTSAATPSRHSGGGGGSGDGSNGGGGAASGGQSTRIGQLQKQIYPYVFLPVSLLLMALTIDPLAVNGILPLGSIHFIYFNLAAFIFTGIAIVVTCTARVHIVVAHNALLQKMRFFLKMALYLVMTILPFVAGNACAVWMNYTPSSRPLGIFLLCLSGGLFIATVAFNIFAASLRTAMQDLTQTNEQLTRSRSNSNGGHRGTSITKLTGSAHKPASAPVHAQLARSLSRLSRFQLYFNILAIVSLLALLYFGIEGSLHAEWTQPDPSSWNVNTQRTAIFHWIILSAFAIILWYSWLPITICHRNLDT